MAYTYSKVTGTNGVGLHTMKGSPVDLKVHSQGTLTSISSLLETGWLYGINGGFFDVSSKTLLSVAIKDGTAVASGGSANAVYDRGTIIWDNAAKKFHCKVLKTKDQIESYITTKTNYWAQGGISLALGKTTSAWKTMIGANGENIPGGLTTSTYRAGLVYNSSNNVWLIVSDGMCTIEAFRDAIIEKVGSGTLVDGISLDGSTCAQMVCAEKSVLRDRAIMSVLGFKK